ncbi:class I SAM-dependent methyltransferase [Tabrizicola piscis]|nr:class I SAM-dependent methyltransferase [Tabrizicola piscis]
MPTDEELLASYDLPEYYTHGKSHFPLLAPGIADRVLIKLAYLRDQGQLMNAQRLLARHPDATSILDIGCGCGDFLAGFSGGERTLVGVDPDPLARQEAALKGLQVLAGTAEDLPADVQNRQFDMVILSHVLEHCRDPKAALRNVRSLLGPSGLFYCEVPNCGSIYFQTHAAISEMLDVPRHLHFFTKDSLARLCAQTGLDVIGWNYHGYTRHFGGNWRAWENQIHDMLTERGAAGRRPRRTWSNSLRLLAQSTFAPPERKYDCIGFFARAVPLDAEGAPAGR